MYKLCNFFLDIRLAMKILLCFVLVIVSVYGAERAKRQSWRGGLWGRELDLENSRRKDNAALLNLFKEGLSNIHQYKSDVADSEARPDDHDRLNLRNEIPNPWAPFPQVTGKERTKFGFLRYPNQRKETQEE